jgi:hypothetical protein
MGKACCTGGMTYTKFWSENVKRRDDAEDPVIDWRIILE